MSVAHALDESLPWSQVVSANFTVEAKLPPRNEVFVDRPRLMKQLSERLDDEHLVWICGQSGFGKTEIALEHAHRKRRMKSHTAIFWIKADSEVALNASLETHLDELYDQSMLRRDDFEDTATRVRKFLDWLLFPGNRNWLLIFDDTNKKTVSLIEQYIPTGTSQGFIIITTRGDYSGSMIRQDRTISSEVPQFLGGSDEGEAGDERENFNSGRFSPPMRVSSFERDEAFKQLKAASLASQTQADEVSDWNEIIANIAEKMETPYQGDQIRRVLARKGGEKAGLILHQLDPKRSGEHAAEHLLVFSSTCPGSRLLDPCLYLGKISPVPMQVAAFILYGRGDLQSQDDVVEEIHKLDGSEETSTWTTLKCSLEVEDIYDDVPQSFIITPTYRKCRMTFLGDHSNHAESCLETAVYAIIATLKTLEETKLRAAHLLDHVVACARNLMEPGRRFKRAVEWDFLARFCEREGYYHEAIWLYDRVIKEDYESVGTTSATSKQMRDVTADSDGWRDIDSDIGTLQSPKVHHVRRVSNQPHSIRLLNSKIGFVRSNLATGLRSDLLERCDEVLDQLPVTCKGAYYDLRVATLEQMIQITRQQRDWARAAALSQDLVDTVQLELGLDDIATITAVSQLGQVFLEASQFHDAQGCFKRVVISLEGATTVDKRKLIAIEQLLANSYREQGDLAAALKTYNDLLSLVHSILGPAHIESAKVQADLARIYAQMGKLDEARKRFDDALHSVQSFDTRSEIYAQLLEDSERCRTVQEEVQKQPN